MTFVRWLVGGIVAPLLLLSACTEEIPTDYTASHREAFLTACSRPLDDPRLLSDVCRCVYDRLERELSFTEFQRVSEDLTAATAASTSTAEPTSSASPALPTEIAQLVADCFTAEADL